MTIIKAIILGFIQGITEFLPISSSGHLSIAQHFLGISGEGSQMFAVLLHLGTLAAVFIVYYRVIWQLVLAFFDLLKDIFTGKFRFKELDGTKQMLVMFVISCVPLLLLLIPVGGGNKLMDVLGGLAEDNDIFVEGVCFLFTAFLLLFSSYRARKVTSPKMCLKSSDALAVGFAQMLAAGFPGISRSGSTISTGMICGVSKDYMVQYSFILGIPAILAANIVELKDAVEVGAPFELLPTVVGVITAAVVGVLAIKVLEWLIKKDKFKFFGYYCLALGVIVIIAGVVECFI